MYIRVISLHFEASMCQEREGVCVRVGGGGAGGEGKERERSGSIAAIVLDLVLLGAALPVAFAGLQELAGADPSVVLR